MMITDMSTYVFALFTLLALAAGQRPGFAGTKPIGFPEVAKPTTTPGLGDRFGEDDVTTQRLPIEAKGDQDLIDRLSKLPVDKQPFWFINWQALEANRKNPQTYPQKPSDFVDPIPNSGPTNNNSVRVPNLNSLNSNGSAVTVTNVKTTIAPNLNSTEKTKVINRFADIESSSSNPTYQSNVVTEFGAGLPSTIFPFAYNSRNRFNVNYQNSRFIPRNPIID